MTKRIYDATCCCYEPCEECVGRMPLTITARYTWDPCALYPAGLVLEAILMQDPDHPCVYLGDDPQLGASWAQLVYYNAKVALSVVSLGSAPWGGFEQTKTEGYLCTDILGNYIYDGAGGFFKPDIAEVIGIT